MTKSKIYRFFKPLIYIVKSAIRYIIHLVSILMIVEGIMRLFGLTAIGDILFYNPLVILIGALAISYVLYEFGQFLRLRWQSIND